MTMPPSGPNFPPSGAAPYGQQPPQPPKKQGLGAGLIAAIVVVALLVVLACCLGGVVLVRSQDDSTSTSSTTAVSSSTTEPTSETTSETTSQTSEPTSETTSESSSDTSSSSSAAGGGSFPDSFDGWTRSKIGQDSSVLATYSKGSEGVSVVASDYLTLDSYELVLDDQQKFGEILCGKTSGQVRCVAEQDGRTYLFARVPDASAKDTAKVAQGFVDAL